MSDIYKKLMKFRKHDCNMPLYIFFVVAFVIGCLFCVLYHLEKSSLREDKMLAERHERMTKLREETRKQKEELEKTTFPFNSFVPIDCGSDFICSNVIFSPTDKPSLPNDIDIILPNHGWYLFSGKMLNGSSFCYEYAVFELKIYNSSGKVVNSGYVIISSDVHGSFTPVSDVRWSWYTREKPSSGNRFTIKFRGGIKKGDANPYLGILDGAKVCLFGIVASVK